jgi:release factor glutamine methyltransferase
LAAYKQILRTINNIIFSPAWVFFECGAGQAVGLVDMLKNGGFLDVNVKKDLAGHDRVVFGRVTAAAKKV